MSRERRFSITNRESSAVEAGLALLIAKLAEIKREDGSLSPYWSWIADAASDLLKRLKSYTWFK